MGLDNEPIIEGEKSLPTPKTETNLIEHLVLPIASHKVDGRLFPVQNISLDLSPKKGKGMNLTRDSKQPKKADPNQQTWQFGDVMAPQHHVWQHSPRDAGRCEGKPLKHKQYHCNILENEFAPSMEVQLGDVKLRPWLSIEGLDP